MAIKRYLKQNQPFFEVYLNTTDLNGKRIQTRRRGFKSQREAERGEFELKRKLFDRRENPIYTWEEWLNVCVERMKLELRPSTVINYDGRMKKWVNPVWKKRLLHEITPQDVHDVIYLIVEGISPNSRRTLLKMVTRIFNMAIEEGIVDKNPALKVKVKVPQPKQSVLNSAEAEKLLREAKLTNHRFYEIWALALLTGMRSGELYALKWNDIDFENKRISVNKAWNSKFGIGPTKTTRNRVVPISKELESLLKEMKLESADEFVLKHPQEWSDGSQAQVLRDFCKSIGITQVKFHDLRATFITQLLLRGVPLAQVMAVVGHTQLKTTNVYLRVAGTDLNGVTDQLSYSLPTEKLAEVIQIGPR